MRLRWATPADAEAGARLHQECWREAYAPLVDPGLLAAQLADPAAWAQRWRDQTRLVPRLLASHGPDLVGFAVAGPARDDDAPTALELYAAYVRAGWYGTGLGHALVDGVIGERPACLWVLEGNDRAQAFYAKLGFDLDQRRQRFDPLDAWEIGMSRGSMRPVPPPGAPA